MHESTFNGCKNLKTVCVEEGCAVGIRKHVSDLVKIIPVRPEITYTKRPDFRRLKDVAIPEGIEKIEELWFAGREVESVMIPASVKEVQAGAFSRCRNLENVIFTQSEPGESSLLKVIGREAFYDCSSLRTIDLPDGLEEI